MSGFNFECPHCTRAQTVTEEAHSAKEIVFSTSDTAYGRIGIQSHAVCCANPDCHLPTVLVEVRSCKYTASGVEWDGGEPIVRKRLLPESGAKPQPSYIPDPIKEDYAEACRVKDLSPKASATLSRRCLQGMIRDFAKIEEKSLYHEIEKLAALSKSGNAPKGVSDDSIESLHHVRSLGNIGAHMEKDINVIIPVDPQEAQILIELIEGLLEEWYVARQNRLERFATLKAAADGKESLRKATAVKPTQ